MTACSLHDSDRTGKGAEDAPPAAGEARFTNERSRRYRVLVNPDGGSYVSLRGGTLAEAEERAESVGKPHAGSNIIVFAAIEEIEEEEGMK